MGRPKRFDPDMLKEELRADAIRQQEAMNLQIERNKYLREHKRGYAIVDEARWKRDMYKVEGRIKPVNGWEGRYLVSDAGYAAASTGRRLAMQRAKTGRGEGAHYQGAVYVQFNSGKRHVHVKLARLVFQHFSTEDLGDAKLWTIDFKDGDVMNCRFSNLVRFTGIGFANDADEEGFNL